MTPPIPQQILPNLYLSDAFAAKAPALLQKYGITHVLSVLPSFTPTVAAEKTESIDPHNQRSQQNINEEVQLAGVESALAAAGSEGKAVGKEAWRLKSWLRVEVEDAVDEDLIRWFGVCNKFIEEGRREGGVLVHCQMGISRSATVVVAYVMQEHEIGSEAALDLVRRVRPRAHPNRGFMEQLKLYHNLGYSIYSKTAPPSAVGSAHVIHPRSMPEGEGWYLKGEYLQWKEKRDRKFVADCFRLQHRLAGLQDPNSTDVIEMETAEVLKTRESLLSEIQNSYRKLEDGDDDNDGD